MEIRDGSLKSSNCVWNIRRSFSLGVGGNYIKFLCHWDVSLYSYTRNKKYTVLFGFKVQFYEAREAASVSI